MICHRCLQRAAARHHALSRSFSNSARTYSTPVSTQVTSNTVPRPNDSPAVLSTSAAQPLSTPHTPSPDGSSLQAPEKTSSKLPRSSVAAGTTLKGLSLMKNVQDPVAMEDHEYPDWLWSVLDKKVAESEGTGLEGDLFAKSKKQRQRAAKALRKQQLLNPEGLAPKIPLHEQTVDLPDEGEEALRAREELTKSMRESRRGKIKEDNFLRAMR